MASPALELKRITKRYPLVLANDDISLNVNWGEVLAIVGENGAGKSTLMKIVFGMVKPDQGEIWVNGSIAHIRDPMTAIELGIGMVHQHFMLVDPFTVLENIILGSEPKMGLQIDSKSARVEIERLMADLDFSLPLETAVEELSIGLQQRVEILKAIYRKAKILILDEPTAVLTPQESDDLFRFIRKFADNGGAVVFISHKLGEVIQASDRVTVIRDGKVVDTVVTSQTDVNQLAKLMVGREVDLEVDKSPATPGEVFLKVENLQVAGRDAKHSLKGVSLEVRSGEILGIAGVEGNGQTELVEAITGLVKYQGKIEYGGEVLPQSARSVRQWGVSHIPEDRNARGLVLDFSTKENSILGDHFKAPNSGFLGFIDDAQIESGAENIVEKYDVRPTSVGISGRRYSGGNAQKVIVGRELERSPKVLIAAQPTRGVDIGAIEFIHSNIVASRDKGMAVLLVSADLNEVRALSDRIVVMFEGRIVGEITPELATDESLGMMMAGLT